MASIGEPAIARLPRAYGILLAGTVLIAACSRESAPVTRAPAVAVARTEYVNEGRLDIIAAPGYLQRGASDPRVDWVSAFEKATACKVNLHTANGSEEMVTLMTQGGVDLVVVPGDASLRLVAGGKVGPLDLSRIPSYESIDPKFRDAAWHTVDGHHYGVPFQWEPMVLMYDSAVFTTPPTSWSVLFEEQNFPDGKPSAGRVQAFASPIHIADAAIYLMASRPELGIADPYQLTEKQYAAALDVLRRQKPLVQRYWQDAAVQASDFAELGVVASAAWPAQVNRLRADGRPIASVIPAEGASGRSDTTMLHSSARHPNCAYAWMEWSLNPRVQGDVAAWSGSIPVVPAACKGNPLLGDDGCATNGRDSLGRIHFWKTPQARCGRGQCVPYSRWTMDYLTITGG